MICMRTLLRCFTIAAFLLAGVSVVFADDTAPQPQEPYIPDIGTFMKIGGASSPDYSRSLDAVLFSSFMSGASQLYRLTD